MTNSISRNQVFAHRGLWSKSNMGKNSEEALSLAIDQGFSVETDIRASFGEVVVSHDPPRTLNNLLLLDDLICLDRGSGPIRPKFALNVKSDGIADQVKRGNSFENEAMDDLYFFDMSIPETLRFSRLRLPFATRASEYEPPEATQSITWPTNPVATWVDGFHGDCFLEKHGSWLLRESEERLLTIVSPELHSRDHSAVLDWFLENASTNPNLTICTDLPWDYLNV